MKRTSTSNTAQTASPGKLTLGAAIVVVVVIVSWTQRQQGGATAPAPSAPQSISSPAPNATTQIVEAVRIGSWNIEWLGKPGDRSGMAENVAQKPDDLADYIMAADVDALALQEIISTGPQNSSTRQKRLRSRELDDVFQVIRDRRGQTWEYVLFPGRGTDAQLTGLAWNTAVFEAVDSDGGVWDDDDEPWRVPIASTRGTRGAGGAGLWNRPPHAFKLRAGPGNTDLVLVVVHMKADSQGDFASHRLREAAALVESIDLIRRTFNDDDIMIIGDTNVTELDEPTLAIITRSGFTDLNAAGLQTHWRGGTMDRIFTPISQPEITSSTMEVVSEMYLQRKGLKPADFKRNYSDHYMVVTTIQVMPDDD